MDHMNTNSFENYDPHVCYESVLTVATTKVDWYQVKLTIFAENYRENDVKEKNIMPT